MKTLFTNLNTLFSQDDINNSLFLVTTIIYFTPLFNSFIKYSTVTTNQIILFFHIVFPELSPRYSSDYITLPSLEEFARGSLFVVSSDLLYSPYFPGLSLDVDGVLVASLMMEFVDA